MPKVKSKPIDSFTLHLPKQIRSLNNTLKDHWSVRGKYKEDWGMLLLSELKRAGYYKMRKNWLPLKKHITITRIMGPRQREFDHDNLVGGCKSLVDAMKGRLIKDDTAEYVSVKYRQVEGERGGTIIEVRFEGGR